MLVSIVVKYKFIHDCICVLQNVHLICFGNIVCGLKHIWINITPKRYCKKLLVFFFRTTAVFQHKYFRGSSKQLFFAECMGLLIYWITVDFCWYMQSFLQPSMYLKLSWSLWNFYNIYSIRCSKVSSRSGMSIEVWDFFIIPIKKKT